MKYILALILVFATSMAFAAPFLVCDPVPGAETIEVMIDGNAQIVTGDTIHIDLAYLATGSHTVKAKACSIWGCGEEANLPFTKSVPVGTIIISIVTH